MSIGDAITILCLIIGAIYVPRYLLRVYAPGVMPAIRQWWERGLEIQRERYERRAAFYGLRDMSTEAEPAENERFRSGSDMVVLPQQNQVEPELVRSLEGVIDFLREHNLTDDEAILILAVLHREAGDLISANKIRDIVGGADAVVKAKVAELRPKPPAPKGGAPLRRPANGW